LETDGALYIRLGKSSLWEIKGNVELFRGYEPQWKMALIFCGFRTDSVWPFFDA